MEEVTAGDIVLHYSDGYVRAISHVQAPALRALYPYDKDIEYGGRQGYLIRSRYFLLEPPVPRETVARLETLPDEDHPFTVTGAVKQGYLFRFGVDALRELVTDFETNWPLWLRDFVVADVSPLVPYHHAALRQFVDEIVNMNLGAVDGRRMPYKPLMLLAAMRTVVEGKPPAFSAGSLLEYYEEFATSLGVDHTQPQMPYFHLTGESFWDLRDKADKPFVTRGRPGKTALQGTQI